LSAVLKELRPCRSIGVTSSSDRRPAPYIVMLNLGAGALGIDGFS
jgi:hypothetical protein